MGKLRVTCSTSSRVTLITRLGSPVIAYFRLAVVSHLLWINATVTNLKISCILSQRR